MINVKILIKSFKGPFSWWQFTKERFDPSSHFAMLLLFTLFHILFASKRAFVPDIHIEPSTIPWNFKVLLDQFIKHINLYAVVVLFYFKLRLYDEIKDYELDCIINPKRPLPRGLLLHRDLNLGIIICLLLEQTFIFHYGLDAIILLLIAQIYSLIMYKEFFIRDIIRPHLTTYAILHTVVTGFLTIALLGVVKNQYWWEAYQDLENLLLAANNWLLFNIFEFGRKTFAPEEERASVDTYSSLFTPYGAFLLQLIQTILSSLCIYLVFKNKTFAKPVSEDHLTIGLMFLMIAFMFISLFYLSTLLPRFAKIYRKFSEAYIILVFTFMLSLIIF